MDNQALLRDHLIVRRQWMDEDSFIQLFAIGQALPGPTSTQLVVSIALARAGPLGGLLAFFMWNLPGLVVLTICGILIGTYIDPNNPPFYLVGLPPAAISLVFTAFYSFAQKLDKFGSCLALVSACVAILINGDKSLKPTSSQYIFPAMMAAGGIITFLDSKRKKPFGKYESPGKGWEAENDRTIKRIGIRLWTGAIIFLVWLAILITVILLVNVAKVKNAYLTIFEVTYRLGSLIFGGGQVLLPLLQSEVVPEWMTKDRFYQGLALAQSMPGPLFNFAAFLGAVYKGVPGAILGALGIFGPGVLLIFAAMPFWAKLRHAHWFRVILHGLNSTAIGLIGAACLILFTSVVTTTADAIVFYFSLILSGTFSLAAPYVIIVGGILGAIISKDAASLGQVKYCSK